MSAYFPGHAYSVNKKGHILVNLWQFKNVRGGGGGGGGGGGVLEPLYELWIQGYYILFFVLDINFSTRRSYKFIGLSG